MIPAKSFRILGIETSCDETAVALLEFEHGGVQVRQNLVSSQVPIHQKYGGVVPEVAARSHVPETVALISEALGIQNDRFTPLGFNSLRLTSLARFNPLKIRGSATWEGLIDAVAVTSGPGLATALRVGVDAARTLAFVSGKPVVGVNHLEGHLASAWLNEDNRKNWKFPLLALVVSGGHTELVLMKDFCDYQIVGQTRDDAAGECFDKSAKLLGLPYPGGPQIAQLAQGGDARAFDLPRPMLDDDTLDFSFSGLKTAVRIEWESVDLSQPSPPTLTHPRPLFTKERGSEHSLFTKEGAGGSSRKEKLLSNFCASLQQAIVDVLVAKTVRAAKKYKINGVLLVGGVSANLALREQMAEAVRKLGLAFLPSDRAYITDNAAMIAAAGYWHLARGEKHDWKKLDAEPEWNL